VSGEHDAANLADTLGVQKEDLAWLTVSVPD
jgi:hypothetical protein